MTTEFLHIGIPVTNKKPGMRYNDTLKLWLTNPEDQDFKVEYLKFEEGGPFPEIMHKNTHVAYRVKELEPYAQNADAVIFGPVGIGPNTRIAFIIQDDTIFELIEEKQ